jgi:16S rRNA (guanine966-N2)-methyltransferase
MKKENGQKKAAGSLSVRVMAGAFKGRVLRYPPSPSVRPTMQRTKASVFDSISTLLPGAVFLDLFCSAGGAGIEASSRGAAFVHFVERDNRALHMLQMNLAACGLKEEGFMIHPMDVFTFIDRSNPADLNIDVIFADPPYNENLAPSILESLSRSGYNRINMLIIEHQDDIPEASWGSYRSVKTSKFGQTHVSFFKPAGGGKL